MNVGSPTRCRSFLSAFGCRCGVLQRRSLDRTHVTDGHGGKGEFGLVIDGQFDTDRISDVFLRQFDHVVQQHSSHSDHDQYPIDLLGSAYNNDARPNSTLKYRVVLAITVHCKDR